MLNTDALNKSYNDDDVIDVSKAFIAVVSGDEPTVKRDPGLIITNEDVRQIQAYIKTGLALPVDVQHVRRLLGDYDSGIKGLEPEAIRDLYQVIQSHCQSWAPLEAGMKQVGGDLNVFAGNMVVTAQQIVEYVKALESYQSLKVDDLTPAQIAQLPPVALVPGEENKLPVLVELFDELRGYLSDHSASTTQLKGGVSVFKDMLKLVIAPNVSGKVKLASSDATTDEVVRLNQELTQLTERIDQKADEYSTYVGYAWIGVWWGPVGVAITGSIYGVKAETVRKEKNALIETKRGVEKQLMELNRLLGLLRTLETDLEELEGRISGATSGLANLESWWVLTAQLVDSSRDRVKQLNNATYLAILVSRFSVIASNWTDIRKQSLDLLTAFNKALESR